MMGRLIDADRLKNDISKWLNPSSYIEEPRMVEVDDVAVSVIMEIEKQPTDYDVDKVVRQLEQLPRYSTWNPNSDNINRARAIEIVKGCGTDESDRWR